MQSLSMNEALFLVLVLSPIVGSFLNMMIYRLPLMMAGNDVSFVRPVRSICPSCKKSINWLHLIPIIGYLIQFGRCFHCKSTIPIRYMLVELMTLGLCVGMLYKVGLRPDLFYYFFLVFGLIVLFWIDIDYQLLPNTITLPLLWLGLFFNIHHGIALEDAVLGAIFGYLVLWSLLWIFRILRGKDIVGYGDLKLTSALGAWLGWQELSLLLFSASTLGIVFFLIRIRDKSRAVAFGPFLIVAGLGLFFVRFV